MTSESFACIYLQQDYDDDVSSITSCSSDLNAEKSLSYPLEQMNKHSSKRKLEDAIPELLSLSNSKKPKMGDIRKSMVYSTEEIIQMLDVIEKVRPKRFQSWAVVQVLHESLWPERQRSVDSLKRKFRELYNHNTNEQHPKVSTLVIARAKHIHNIILLDSTDYSYDVLQAVTSPARPKHSAPKLKPIHVPCPLYEPIPMVIEVPSIHSLDNSHGHPYSTEQDEHTLDHYNMKQSWTHQMTNRDVMTPPLVSGWGKERK